jgi:hypothetical protein
LSNKVDSASADRTFETLLTSDAEDQQIMKRSVYELKKEIDSEDAMFSRH